MLILSALSSIVFLFLPVYFFFANLFVNFISSPHNFTIDELPFVVTIHHSDVSEDAAVNNKDKKENDKKSHTKKWDFTESQYNSQQPTKQQPYNQQMKSQIEQSSSGIRGTSEDATLLRIYLNKGNN
ncbi:unknown [Crocosphaera subtropica ATCC 51142]|uniref:Uncharacterized protein n=1 Tax=Crocosphaera subtropica (strain ATCC 51142 / BH68) TaxID=43989 RepID=B1WRS9_CROS5|nr:hypothetical protein [Crocosphaera subtropica]ACB53520.1 unknown [Crocosphaera subtropica ATCC 51142]